ncbi:ester cyclase [Agromyces sp. SYSU T00194]|uniref:ester cyclase n=1 Tax=Agromyces chitinivorans TaxID=3158560 RepID=UPI00339B7124
MRRDDVVRSLFDDGWNRGDFTPTADWLGDFRVHVGGRTMELDAPATHALVARWRTAFPDLRFDVHRVVDGGDEFAVHLTLTGTHRGEWNGHPATGNRMSVPHAMFIRFDGDRITDIWEVLDSGAMDAQLASG